jgi:hypothetical protein
LFDGKKYGLGKVLTSYCILTPLTHFIIVQREKKNFEKLSLELGITVTNTNFIQKK